MTVKILFQIYRFRTLNRYESVAIHDLNGRVFSIKELGQIVNNYTINCTPKFENTERPSVKYFELEFEDYMYNAFLIGET